MAERDPQNVREYEPQITHGKAHTVRFFPFRGAENTPPDPGGTTTFIVK